MKQNTNTINVTCSYSNHLQSVSLLTRLLLGFLSWQMSMLRYTGSCLQCWNCNQPCMSCWYRYSNASSTYRSHRKQTRRTCLWKRIVFYLQRFSLELQYKQFIDRLSTDGEFIQSSRRSAGGCVSVCVYATTECVAALAEGKVLGCMCSLLFLFFSSSPCFHCSVTLSFLSHNLHGNKMKPSSMSSTQQ